MEEPKNCIQKYKKSICEDCEFNTYIMVGHPGGSSTNSTEKYFCEHGHWEDDF